jgi:hypothetical protein
MKITIIGTGYVGLVSGTVLRMQQPYRVYIRHGASSHRAYQGPPVAHLAAGAGLQTRHERRTRLEAFAASSEWAI